MTFRADLHCHTLCSDGSLSPEDVVSEAVKEGLQGLSITDHDTIAAYESAIPIAKEKGLLLGTGVEFSCEFSGESTHILGYDFDLNNQALLSLCDAHQTRRQNRNRIILDKLRNLKMPIEEEELNALTRMSKGRMHIAYLLLKKGYVSSIKEAFYLFLGEGKKAYAPGQTFQVQETIDIIHQAQGKAFVAHPHFIKRRRIIKSLLNLNFDGIECYYAKIPPEQEHQWVKIANEKNWLISGGSDFHGFLKPHIPLGCSWVDEPTFHKIFSRSLNENSK